MTTLRGLTVILSFLAFYALLTNSLTHRAKQTGSLPALIQAGLKGSPAETKVGKDNPASTVDSTPRNAWRQSTLPTGANKTSNNNSQRNTTHTTDTLTDNGNSPEFNGRKGLENEYLNKIENTSNPGPPLERERTNGSKVHNKTKDKARSQNNHRSERALSKRDLKAGMPIKKVRRTEYTQSIDESKIP